jgi:hypothetical protein
MNLVVVMLGFLATITLVLSYAVNDYTAQKSVLKNSQLSTALQQAIVFTNTEFNNYKLYSPNNATPLNNLPDTFINEGNGVFGNGSGWKDVVHNMPFPIAGSPFGQLSNSSNSNNQSSSGNTNTSNTNQLSCGNNWPSNGYLYITIVPPSGFTQLDARKMAEALQNNNWNFQGYQASAPIQVNVGYIDQNGILQPFGYKCNQPLQPNTVVEIIGPMT